jgi:hypothetical protein
MISGEAIGRAKEHPVEREIHPVPEKPTSVNKKVAAFARTARFGEHGAKHCAGNF